MAKTKNDTTAVVPTREGFTVGFQEFLDLEIAVTQARSLVDVLQELCLPGGDSKAGAVALDQLGPEKLYSTLGLLGDALANIDSRMHCAQAVRNG